MSNVDDFDSLRTHCLQRRCPLMKECTLLFVCLFSIVNTACLWKPAALTTKDSLLQSRLLTVTPCHGCYSVWPSCFQCADMRGECHSYYSHNHWQVNRCPRSVRLAFDCPHPSLFSYQKTRSLWRHSSLAAHRDCDGHHQPLSLSRSRDFAI